MAPPRGTALHCNRMQAWLQHNHWQQLACCNSSHEWLSPLLMHEGETTLPWH